MNDISTMRLAETSRRHYGLAALRGTIAIWRERRRFRHDLEQMWKENPHLIDDIGLTPRQVETEFAKPFWQAYGEYYNGVASPVSACRSGWPAVALVGSHWP